MLAGSGSPAGAYRVIMDGNGRWAKRATCPVSPVIEPE